MRCASPVIVLLGILAVCTFHVEQSSAAALRDVVASYSEVGEPVSIELISTYDNGIASAAKNAAKWAKEHLANAVKGLQERLANIIKGLQEQLDQLTNRVSKEGLVDVATDIAQKAIARLKKIRAVASKIADRLGENSYGEKARNIIKKVDEVLEKLSGVVGEKKNAEDKSPVPVDNKQKGTELYQLYLNDDFKSLSSDESQDSVGRVLDIITRQMIDLVEMVEDDLETYP